MYGVNAMDENTAKKLILSILVVVICLEIGALVTASSGAEDQPATITVSAASSLTEAFTDIAKEFEAAHPGTKVELNFASSGTLRMQIESGAPIDVFASASQNDMKLLSEKNLIENSSKRTLHQIPS